MRDVSGAVSEIDRRDNGLRYAPWPMRRWLRRAGEPTVVFLLYGLLAMTASWPLVRDFSTRLTGDIWFDQRHAVWMLWHVKEALLGRQPLFHADLLYPPHGMSTLVDGVGIVSGLFALPFWPWGPAAAYNGASLLGLTLSGWCMYLLVRVGATSAIVRVSAIPRAFAPATAPETAALPAMTDDDARLARLRTAAFLAGAIFLLYPIHLIGLHGHIEKIFVGLLPLNVLAGLFAFDPARSRGWLTTPGLALLLALLHNGNQFMFAALALVVLALICAVTRERRRLVIVGPVFRRALAAGAIAAVVVGPMLIRVASVARDPELETAIALNSVRFMPDALQFLAPSTHQAVMGSWFYVDDQLRMDTQSRRSIVPALNPEVDWQGCGIETAATIPLTAIVLAIVARRARYEGTGRWLVFVGVFAVLALGPYLRIAGWSEFTIFKLRILLPYAVLVSLPGFDVLRTPVRFMMIGGVGVAVLAAWGLLALMARASVPRRAVLVAAATIAIVLVECWPRAWPQQELPPVPDFYRRLASDPERYAVLDLPSARRSQDFASLYMYYQTVHGKGIAWAYLSRAYREYPLTGVDAIFESHTADGAETRARLAALGYRYVVWHKRALDVARRLSPEPGRYRVFGRAPVRPETHPLIRDTFAGEPPIVEDDFVAVYRIAPR